MDSFQENTKQFYLTDSLTGQGHHINKPMGAPISVYACGITPYSDSHVGHARSYAVFDLLERVLCALGYQPQVARNITDIDDKILAAARKEGVAWDVLSKRFAQKNRDLMHLTGFKIPQEPMASAHIPQIVEHILALIQKGYAYVSSQGDVLYRVSAFNGAVLMNHKEGSLKSEQGMPRVDQTGKEDSRDFALWKSADASEPGWITPWGWGRPGWHIECSAMIGKTFGGSVDIHGGGVDLKFPHHQAEMMQSEAVYERPLAQIWMHHGSVLSSGKKMSKSLGNFVTWQEGLESANNDFKGNPGDVLKIALLSAHWQKPINWEPHLMARAKDDLLLISSGFAHEVPAQQLLTAKKGLITTLSGNLNYPLALHQLRSMKRTPEFPAMARALADLSGLFVQYPLKRREELSSGDAGMIQELVLAREKARKNHDWKLADQLRDQLLTRGYAVQDQRA